MVKEMSAICKFWTENTRNRCAPIHIHANIHAKRKGPGPSRALMYKKKTLPTKRKAAMITPGFGRTALTYSISNVKNGAYRCFDVSSCDNNLQTSVGHLLSAS